VWAVTGLLLITGLIFLWAIFLNNWVLKLRYTFLPLLIRRILSYFLFLVAFRLLVKVKVRVHAVLLLLWRFLRKLVELVLLIVVATLAKVIVLNLVNLVIIKVICLYMVIKSLLIILFFIWTVLMITVTVLIALLVVLVVTLDCMILRWLFALCAFVGTWYKLRLVVSHAYSLI
jgi:hypothetical protein